MIKKITSFLGIPKIDGSFIAGLFLVTVIAALAGTIAELGMLQHYGVHALLVGMLLGMLYANTINGFMPPAWHSGIDFAAKRILRLAIILYGFRLTLQDVVAVGPSGIVIAALMVGLTFLIG